MLRSVPMRHPRRLVDRQIGRNAQLFTEAAAGLDTAEARYPYLRILVSLIEGAHPEWNQPEQKARQISGLARRLSDGALDADEVADVVRARDEERGLAA